MTSSLSLIRQVRAGRTAFPNRFRQAAHHHDDPTQRHRPRVMIKQHYYRIPVDSINPQSTLGVMKRNARKF